MSDEPPKVPLRVRLPYGSEAEFSLRYGAHVSRGSLFLATRAPKPEGTPLTFELVLSDGARLMRGEGVVQTVTQVSAAGRSGMLVRLTRVDASTKALIERIVSARVEATALASPPAGAPPLPPSGSGSGLFQVEVSALAQTPPATASGIYSIEDAPASPRPAVPPLVVSPPTVPRSRVHDRVAPLLDPPEPTPLKPTAAPTGKPVPPPLVERPTPVGPGPTPIRNPPGSSPSGARPPLPAAALPVAAAPDRPVAPATSLEVDQPPFASRVHPIPVAADPARLQATSLPRAPAHPVRTADRPAQASSLAPSLSARPLPGPDDEVVLGVDLGTWSSRAAVHLQGRTYPVPIASERGATSLPSAVGWDPAHGLVVGTAALTLRARSPQLTVRGAKRLLGRRARAPRDRDLRLRFAHDLVSDEAGDLAVTLGDRAWPVPELLAALLEELKVSAEAMVHGAVRRAVIAVPAWFTEHQRAQVLEAARAAGLEVAALLNEPSAVALAFGDGRSLARKRLLIYDLGAGAFQVAVVAISGEDLEVVAVGGDEGLGGMDFDARLADALLSGASLPSHQLVLAHRGLLRVRDAVEVAKRALDGEASTRVAVPDIGATEQGQSHGLEVEVERSALELVTRELIERTLEVTEQVLESAGLTPRSLDEVVVVGGQGRSAAVRASLQQLVGRAPSADFEVAHAVAVGAALFGHSLGQRRQGKRGTSLSEVLATPISVATQGGRLQRVLDRNTRLPAERSLQVPVRAGRPVAVPVFQGQAPHAEDPDYLGCARLSSPRDGELVMRFSVGADGRLTLTLVGPLAPGASLTFDPRLPSEEDLAQLLAQSPLPRSDAPASPPGLWAGVRRLFGR
jgi:uncharacterized protein (TIGR02266 family)